jgi:hypothetical protein
LIKEHRFKANLIILAAGSKASPPCFGGANMNTEKKSVRSRTSEMVIGKTTYIVTTTFNEKATETVEQKFIRYVSDRISSDVNKSDIGLTAVKI